MSLSEEIRAAINRHSAENYSNTPDFILANYLMDCLAAFDIATIRREGWYGRDVGERAGAGEGEAGNG